MGTSTKMNLTMKIKARVRTANWATNTTNQGLTKRMRMRKSRFC